MFKLGNFTFMNFMFKYQFSLNGFKIRLLPNVCMLCGAEGLIKKKKKEEKKNTQMFTSVRYSARDQFLKVDYHLESVPVAVSLASRPVFLPHSSSFRKAEVSFCG